MSAYALFEQSGAPFTGRRRAATEEFLKKNGLDYDEQIEYSVNLVDDAGQIAASGSLRANILQCIATDPRYRGEGLTARIVTLLQSRAFSEGKRHLFLFTKPENRVLFEGVGFYPIAETPYVLLLENEPNGIRRYLSTLSRPPFGGTVGAIVANCDPFTRGHRSLVERAAAQCDTLHLFILSEDRGMFSTDERLEMAQRGVHDLNNVLLHPSSDYLISAATFPTYFHKDKARAGEVNCALDIQIFGEYFVPTLGITRRFVGQEPFCAVTAAYNEALKQLLPRFGVEVSELPRLESEGTPISATKVREAWMRRDFAALAPLVPQSTLEYLRALDGRAAR